MSYTNSQRTYCTIVVRCVRRHSNSILGLEGLIVLLTKLTQTFIVVLLLGPKQDGCGCGKDHAFISPRLLPRKMTPEQTDPYLATVSPQQMNSKIFLHCLSYQIPSSSTKQPTKQQPNMDHTKSMEVAYSAFMAANPNNPATPTDYVRTIIPEDYFSPDVNEDSNCWTSPLAHHDTTSGGYTLEVVNAIRSNDIGTLQRLYEAGHCFDVCNSNGEYLIHLACRRANPATVEFLLQVAGVQAAVRDRQGRTILHDVCWKSTPDVAMMSTVLRLAPPELLLARDCRGHTPFDFARKQHSQAWNDFLNRHSEFIQGRLFEHYFNKWLVAEEENSGHDDENEEMSRCDECEG